MGGNAAGDGADGGDGGSGGGGFRRSGQDSVVAQIFVFFVPLWLRRVAFASLASPLSLSFFYPHLQPYPHRLSRRRF